MTELKKKLHNDHQEIYNKLDELLHELTLVKNTEDHYHLQKTCADLINYVKNLLKGHFKEEEVFLFPEILASQAEESEFINRLINDHKEIEDKYNQLTSIYEDYSKRIQDSYFNDFDYKKQVLFPAYNLIATINHHAIREDAIL
jgi:iron-sulfur cluster repair protein YtfE (RIC family)